MGPTIAASADARRPGSWRRRRSTMTCGVRAGWCSCFALWTHSACESSVRSLHTRRDNVSAVAEKFHAGSFLVHPSDIIARISSLTCHEEMPRKNAAPEEFKLIPAQFNYTMRSGTYRQIFSLTYTLKNIRISTDISWRVFHILTEPVPLKHGKNSIGTKYPWIYGYFYGVLWWSKIKSDSWAVKTVNNNENVSS